MNKRQRRYLVMGFVVATALELWVFTDLLWADLDSQRRVALILGPIAILVGSLWILGLAWTPVPDRRAMWLVLTGPLGGMQFFSGLGLLLFVTGFERLMIIAGLAVTGCFCAFVSLLVWPRISGTGRD
jgi:hypothetical protein